VLTVSTALAGYLDWPGACQVFRLERRRVQRKSDVVHTETVYGLTDLTPAQASASDLLAYVRGQWLIENRSHWQRDVVFDEDRSQVRVGSIPEVMAALRNAVIGLLRISAEPKIATATRRFAAQPWAALRLLGINREN
jgi:predicted transposase YbfD/YdcC